MNPTDILGSARAEFAGLAERLVALVDSLPDSTAPILPGTWTIRDAALHIALEIDGCAELASGTPCPHVYTDPKGLAQLNDARIADVPEADPHKLAVLMRDAADRFLKATDGGSADRPLNYYGVDCTLAHIACSTGVFEWAMHGYDMALATGRPWRIDPVHAQLSLYGLGPWFAPMCNVETTAGHTGAYQLELGGDALVVRFVDGELTVEPAGAGPVDCVLTADPVAFLLVAAGRMTQWQAIALGLMSAGGDRPELALGFLNLFAIP